MMEFKFAVLCNPQKNSCPDLLEGMEIYYTFADTYRFNLFLCCYYESLSLIISSISFLICPFLKSSRLIMGMRAHLANILR